MYKQSQTWENCRFKQEKETLTSMDDAPDNPEMWCKKKGKFCFGAESCAEWELKEI